MRTLQEHSPAVNGPEVEHLGRLAERETVIQYDDADELATVWTCHRALAAALKKRGVEVESIARNAERPVSWCFRVPKDWVSVRPPRNYRLSEEERADRRQRLNRVRDRLAPRPAIGVSGEGRPLQEPTVTGQGSGSRA